jgi:hypothetical protein
MTGGQWCNRKAIACLDISLGKGDRFFEVTLKEAIILLLQNRICKAI